MEVQDSANRLETDPTGIQGTNEMSETAVPSQPAEDTPPAPVKRKKWRWVLLVLVLMMLSFLAGWRLMAYRWWPVLSPYVKQVVYAVAPSLQPEVVAQEVTVYTPDADAKLHDPIAVTDSLFYYFYYPTCPYCANYANMLFAGLPDEIMLPDGTVSRVMMVAVNKHDEAEYPYMEAYYHEHGIVKNEEQNDQVVPSVVIGDRYLRGTNAIRDFFYRLLLSGEGLNTPLIDGEERVN